MSHDVMRTTYRKLTVEEQAIISRIKLLAEDLHNAICEAGSNRELAIARGKVEEAVFWATKGLSGPAV